MTAEDTSLRYAEHRKRLARLRLIDDDFMTACFDGNTACMELVLRIVLEEPGLVVQEVRTQVEMKNLPGRSVRLDVVATDSSGRTINVEVQRTDRGAGRRRARYHSSAMDTALLDKGADFDQLPDTYVIFITEHDVIGRNQPVYKVERCILDTGELFDDGAHILYVNGAYRDESPVGRLMHDFFCTQAKDMHYAVLAERVSYFKESKEGSSSMCRVLEEMCEDHFRKGEQKGAYKERLANARRMLADGLSMEKIAEYSLLSLDEIRRLQASQED